MVRARQPEKGTIPVSIAMAVGGMALSTITALLVWAYSLSTIPQQVSIELERRMSDRFKLERDYLDANMRAVQLQIDQLKKERK